MKSLLCSLLILLTPSLWAADYIPDFSAKYSVQLNGLQAGELKRSLSTEANGVRHFKTKSQAEGVFAFFKPDLVEESSRFQADASSLLPLSYLYQRTGGKKEKYLSLKFDWIQQKVHIDDKKHPWSLNIEANTLDKLSYQIALMGDLSPNKTDYSYQIADGGKVKTYNIKVLGEEIINTPLGKINTLKLMRMRDTPKGRQTTLWCAPDLHYMPVKLQHKEKGSTFTALLSQLKGIATATAFEAPAAKNQPFGGH